MSAAVPITAPPIIAASVSIESSRLFLLDPPKVNGMNEKTGILLHYKLGTKTIYYKPASYQPRLVP